MPSQNNIVMNIETMFQGLKGESRQKLDSVAKLFAKTFDKFAKPFGINIDKNSIKTINDLEKKFRELGITATQAGKQISLSMKTADGKFVSTSFQYEGGVAGKGTARLVQGATVQSASYLKPTEQLRRNYENVIKARKELDSLEQKGFSKTSDTWQQAEKAADAYNDQLYDTIEALKQRYNLTVDIDRQNDKIIWGDGKGQLETMGRKYQHGIDYSASKAKDTAAIEAEAKAHQENTQKVREYVSALKEQWEQENKLATLKKSKAPQDQINQQQKVVKMATDHTNALKNQVKGTKEYAEVEKQLEYAQEKQKQKQLELNQVTKKSTSLFGNFKNTLKQVISAGLSWKIFSAITQSFKEMYTTVIDLDKALVNLQMVMGTTREQAKALLLEYNEMAQSLGATTEQIATQAVEWQRQGYSVEDTNTLIKNSTVLAKVGMLEEAEAQEYLTAAMKGYRMSVEESIGIVDQLASIDLKAAVSAGGLAEAMSRTSNTAQMAGVEMNQLLGYLAVVGETTQKSMNSIGESFKTIFARFGNIKAGKFVDDETGESLNDVAKVLSKFNIELYDSEGNMRNVNTILTELSQGWENYTQVQKNAIASAVAGVRQYENFIVLMNNFGKAQDYAGIATESAGIAMEKFGGYTEGIEATMNELKTTAEEVALKFIDSETIITIMETLSNVVGFLADNVWVLEGAVRALLLLGIVKGMQLIGNGFKTLILRANNFTTATVGMQGAIRGVTAGTFNATTATNIFNQAMAMLGMTTTGVTAKEAIRQLKMTGLWNTIQGLDFATKKQILTMMGYDAQVVKEILKTGSWSAANITLSGTFKGLGAAIKGMMASNPVGWIMLAVSAVIELCMWMGTLNDETDELAENQETAAEKLDRLSDELDTAKTAAEDATKALEDNLAAIRELEAKESLTYVEDEELQKLRDATQELRWQAELKNQTFTDTQRQYLEEQRKYYDDMIASTEDMQYEYNPQTSIVHYPTKEELEALGFEKELIEDIIAANNGLEGDHTTTIDHSIQHSVDYLRDLEEQGDKTLEMMAKDFEDYANEVEGAGRPTTKAVLMLYDNAKKELNELYSLGAEASEEDIKKTQENLGKYSSELRTRLGDVQSFIESVTSVPENQRLEIFGSDWEEKLNTAIQTRDTLLRVLDPSAYKEIKFSEFLDLDGLKEIKTLVSDLGFEGGLTADILKEKLGEQGYGDLEKKIKSAGLSIETFISWLNSQTNATEKAAQNISAIKEEIEGLKDVYSTLSNSIEEYNNQGYFNYETMQKILDLGDEYIGYLIDENGNIRKNTNALEDYLKLKLQEQAYNQALNYAKSFQNKTDEEAIKIIQGKTLATEGVVRADIELLMTEIALLPVSYELKEQILQQSLAMIEYAGNASFASDSTKDAKEATEEWEKVLNYANTILDEQIEKLEAEQEALEKLTEEKIKAHEAEIKRLEEEKEALEDKNEEKNKELELEELERNLQKAKQRTMRVYREGYGWIWEQDPEALQEAQKELDDFYTEQEIENIEDLIEAEEDKIDELEENLDKEIKSYEERIKAIKDYKEEWNKVKKEHEKAQNEIIAKAQLGANAEKEILVGADEQGGRLKVLNDFKTGYTNAIEEVAKKTESSVQRINNAFGGLNFEKIKQDLGEIASIEYYFGTTDVETTYAVAGQLKKTKGFFSGEEFYYDSERGVYYKGSDLKNIINSSEGISSFVIPAGTHMYNNAYASGTVSAKAGLATVDEKGNELIVPKQGRYRMMEYGDTVVPHNLSQRIFEVASNPLRFITNALNSVKTPNLMSNSSRISNASTINIGTIELPSVTNGESFIKQLQLIAANR